MSLTIRRRLTERAPVTLAAGAIADFAVVLSMGGLARGPLRDRAHAIDGAIDKRAKQSKRRALDPVMSVAGCAGEPFVLYPMVGLAAARWAGVGRTGDAATLALALTGSAALNKLTKSVIGRPRPRFRLVPSSGSSFPSQHVTMSLATYGALVYLINRRRKRRAGRVWAGAWAAVLALVALVGWSRIYQGAHHPTDIFGGLVQGALWLTTCAVFANSLDTQKR
jgi:membrane-associated phospholipid phosphatase